MKNLIYILLIPFILGSCTPKISFTTSLKNELGINEDNVKKLQFYVSQDIILYRAKDEGNSKIKGGNIIINSQKFTDQVVIKKGTPGVAVKTKDDKIAVSFECDNNQFLLFGASSNDDSYKILAKEWTSTQGVISYSGKDYFLHKNNASSVLLVKLKHYNKYNRKLRKLKGRRI